MNALQKIRMGLVLANIKLGRVCTHDESYPKDPNPENWRTISGAKVHLTNGRIDGGASGKFKGKAWTGAKPHGSNSFFPERRQQQNLFSNSWEKMRTNKEESNVARISRRAKERKARYEAKKAAGLAKQAEVRAYALNTMKEFTSEVKSNPKAAAQAKAFLEHKKNAKYKDTPEYKELEAAVKAAKESKKTSPSGLGQKLNSWKDYDEHVLHAPITEEERAEAEKVIGDVPVANHTKRDLVREAVMVKRHDQLLKEIDEDHPLYTGIKNYRDLYQRYYDERLTEGQKSHQQAQILAEYNPKIESAAQKWGKARTDKTKEAAAQEYINEVMARDAKLNPKAFPASLAGVKRGNPMTPAKADSTNANPNFNKSAQYRINCQTCVVAYEARLRGYDVTATGNTKGSLNQQLACDSTLAWKTQDGYPPTRMEPPRGIYGTSGRTTPKKLTKWLEDNVVEGQRYTLSVVWNRRRSGHIVSVWKNPKNNQLEIIDPQTGGIISNLHGNKTGKIYESVEAFFSNVSQSNLRPPRLTRVDDLEFDNEFVDKLLSRRKKK